MALTLLIQAPILSCSWQTLRQLQFSQPLGTQVVLQSVPPECGWGLWLDSTQWLNITSTRVTKHYICEFDIQDCTVCFARSLSPLLVILSVKILSHSVILLIYIFLALLGLCCYKWAFFSCKEQGLCSSFSVWAFCCSDFPCCIAQALDLRLRSCGTWAPLPH